MVKTKSCATPYRTTVTNGRAEIAVDTMKEGVGSDQGFRPHELLEAAVGACMSIGARLAADELGVGAVEVTTDVALDRAAPGRAVFRCRVGVSGPLTEEQRAALEDAAFGCAVGETLRRECVLVRERVAAADPGAAGVRWNAADYQANASAQRAWGRELHDRLALRPDDVVLDLGCGDGRLTADLADRVAAGRVCGIDVDPDMIAFARRTHARHNLTFVEGDVRTFAFDGRATRIVSAACLHWVAEHDEVLRRCRAHLAPGGRLLLQMGGVGNCASVLKVAAGVARESPWSSYLQPFTTPWSFYGPEAYRAWLPQAGLRQLRAELTPKDMVHDGPDGLAGWMRTTWMPVLQRLPDALRPAFIAAVVERYLRAHPPDAQGRTHVAMVRLEVEAEAI